MATGRTVKRHARFYMDGYDLSAYVKQFGPLAQEFDVSGEAALTDEVMNVLPGVASVTPTGANGFFDSTATSGLHAVANGAGQKRVLLCPIGIQAAPAQGDPAFMGEFEQLAYSAEPGDAFVTVNVPFGGADAVGAPGYVKPWGTLLHAKGAETAANTAVGVDDNGAATAFGGFLVYQLFSSNGTVTLKVQDAASNLNASFADLSGATSGSIDASSAPVAGLVALGTTATVRRYLRWQISLGTATTATFALGFVRALF